jgi:putative copper export protein
MTIEPWLLFLHVLGAVAWVGGGLTIILVAMATMRRADPAAVADFGRTMAYVGPRLFAPSVAIVAITGVWMVLTISAWDFTQLWVLIGIGCLVVAFGIGAGYIARIGIALGRPTADETQAATLLRRWINAYLVVLAVLVVAIWDMTVKPGL